MRSARIKDKGDACYHVISRVVDRQHVLTDDEKDRFRRLMRKLEAFCGIEVLTYAFMDNHLHILLHIPRRQPVSDEELIRRMRFIYDEQHVENTESHLKELRAQGENRAADKVKAEYTYRMYDLSEFMKTFKQRYTQSYNRRHDRKGTLWEERYKSLLVEGRQNSLSTVGAYIDLNAVRANIVKDPKDYRFCGYGEAVAGVANARQGISHIVGTLNQAKVDWPTASRTYRQLLYITGEARGVNESGQPIRPGFSPKEVQAVLANGGVLPLGALLHCKVRYFTNGAILGCRRYVNEKINHHRSFFGKNRKTGATPMKGGDWNELHTARRLRLNVIIPLSPTG